MAPPAPQRLFSFIGGPVGPWRIRSSRSVVGARLEAATHLAVVAGPSHASKPATGEWTLRGITSNERYVVRDEKTQLAQRQETLGRPASTWAALIPIRKSPAWWALTQDERREIFEAQSAHIAIGLLYLPAVARRLHHCRDLGGDEPFDFLTWFEYAPADEPAFDELLDRLRATPEWRFVDREVDLRLERSPAAAGLAPVLPGRPESSP